MNQSRCDSTSAGAGGDREQLDLLKQQVHQSFDQCIGGADRVAFLMYPMDGNVGNHMMWMALVDYLQERGIVLAYAASRRSFRVDDLRRAIGTDPILFSGGVTMSRLWPAHADMKRTVAAEFPRNRLVALTSTMIFVDEDDAAHAGSVFGTHQDTFVLARDPKSGDNARAVLDEHITVVTAPDSAFGLHPTPRAAEGLRPVIWLARDDHEASGAALPDAETTFDWSSDFRGVCPSAHRTLRVSKALARLRSHRYTSRAHGVFDPAIVKAYARASREIIALGHRTLDEGRVLVTDRMHPHVLAALRGQTVVLLPDRFGKNRAVFEYSTSTIGCVHWADDPLIARDLAHDLAEQRHD